MSTNIQNDMRVTVRVDKDLKERAELLFERLGMNMSTALNVFLRKAVEESAIPFEVSTKAAGFSALYSENAISGAFNAAVAEETRKNQQQGLPIARYDAEKKQAYLEMADGSWEYIYGG